MLAKLLTSASTAFADPVPRIDLSLMRDGPDLEQRAAELLGSRSTPPKESRFSEPARPSLASYRFL